MQVSRPLRREWSVAAIVVTCVGIVLMLGFRLLLAQQGLRLMDLYPRRPSGAPSPGAAGLVNLGSSLGYFCLLLAFVSLPYCLIVTGVAIHRRDFRTVVIAAVCAVLSLVYGLLSLQLGFVIIGI
jgi:hypothetical protein